MIHLLLKCDYCEISLGDYGFRNRKELLDAAVLAGWYITQHRHLCDDCAVKEGKK